MSDPAFRPADFLAPRYWGTWLALGLLRLLIVPPYRWQVRIGAALGRLLYLVGRRRRRITETNIARAFPQLDPAARRHLVKQTFRAAGIALPETALAWWGRDEDLAPLVHFEGMQYLEAALAEGKGVLLLGGHFSSIEISARLMALRHRCYAMYRPHENPLFEAVIKRSRERHLAGLVARDDMRKMIRTLRQGEVVWYAPDQDFGRRRSVFAPFFGIQTATLVMTSKLAKVSGAPVLPFISRRTEGERGYRIIIRPPLADFPSGDDIADATRVNAVLEEQVRQAPEQYLWLHRRFKTRPEGEPPFYAKR